MRVQAIAKAQAVVPARPTPAHPLISYCTCNHFVLVPPRTVQSDSTRRGYLSTAWSMYPKIPPAQKSYWTLVRPTYTNSGSRIPNICSEFQLELVFHLNPPSHHARPRCDHVCVCVCV